MQGIPSILDKKAFWDFGSYHQHTPQIEPAIKIGGFFENNLRPNTILNSLWLWNFREPSFKALLGYTPPAQMLCFHFLFLCNLKKYSQQRGNFLLSQGRKWHRKEVKWCFLWLLRLEVNIHAGSGDRRGGGNITVYSDCSALSQCYTGHTRHKPVTTL